MKTIIAIDPGAHGAIVGHNTFGTWVHNFESESGAIETLLTTRALARNESSELVAYIEQVGGYVGKQQPGSAMFTFGRNFGFWLGALAALEIRTVLVRPQVWQKGIPSVAGTAGVERKRALKDAAARAFPKLKPTLATADALLILDYAARQEHHA